ncbi:BrxE family protein [Defluviimonas sp. WL0024]|uniref:BrxE family protein n=1 Tax=Albidovulum salinarum TaxID=2984153 RepID=A0ABT2X6F8_9RHOB|nr:BrxE family protein [Defluviimonas sp. WL0024]MCU9849319.1 BrxE family protein [Defluviimonas sp. WL0024]
MTDDQRKRVDSDVIVSEIMGLRLCVGYLGEKEQSSWWTSLWLSPHASAFLSPIYGSRADAARLNGVTEAARRVHDNRIGIGRVFHLFRLPEALESRLHDASSRTISLGPPNSVEDARNRLASIARNTDKLAEGPIRIGTPADLLKSEWTAVVAGRYHAAFQAGTMTFPYFAEA